MKKKLTRFEIDPKTSELSRQNASKSPGSGVFYDNDSAYILAKSKKQALKIGLEALTIQGRDFAPDSDETNKQVEEIDRLRNTLKQRDFEVYDLREKIKAEVKTPNQKHNQKIEAIKQLRLATGMGLKLAKEIVELIMEVQEGKTPTVRATAEAWHAEMDHVRETSGYRAHCHDRETAVEFAELREELARVTAERDRLAAKVARVQELATVYEQTPPCYTSTYQDARNDRTRFIGNEILAALESDHG